MKLPRDVSGHDLARTLKRFGYTITRQTGSPMRLTTNLKGVVHHVTIPAHDFLRIGTLSQILSEVASYLELSRDKLIQALFS